ncbi:MAG: MerR family DNA-binding protein [Gammaproteobacteria bacterium]|nr:MerR family DNA-binding protein [Gammaproteobacteria bacterium]MBU1491107.1 MerR family DNA-binding protein [Gammaproteobacteria bacterium]MBU2065871.1 MerR family DNA-binding protein [Gammaproteobacteria bacterium]MBU2141197.1 MerR family DNA-binding protein [Gammaproteobacteria bacterium]MBU2215785.1 MerR family DNA-binding protein [Gammaproteobacteria bacterium]
MNRAFNIGQLSRESGVNPETIRFYERSGLLAAPPRSAAGYRQYAEADVRRLRFIRRGRELGFSLEEITTLLALDAQPHSPCVEADRLVREHLAAIEVRIADLQRMQVALSKLATCDAAEAEHCRLLEALDNRECALHPPVTLG